MADLDAELVTALKMAKSKKMNFVFVPRGGSDGKLILSKAKIPDKEIAEVRKEIGGGTPIKGKCIGEFGNMLFQVLKPPPPTMPAALKKVIKLNAGLTVIPNVMTAADAEAEEEDAKAAHKDAAAASATPSAAAKGAAAGAPPAAGAAAAAGAKAGGDPKVRALQEKLKALGCDPGKIDGLMGPNTQGGIKKFQKLHNLPQTGVVDAATQAALDAAGAPGGGAPAPGAPAPGAGAPPAGKAPPGKAPPGKEASDEIDLSAWQAARAHAIKELRALAAKIAATKHPDAGPVLKEIDAIMKKLPEKLAPQDVESTRVYIETSPDWAALKECPKHFHDMDLQPELLAALKKKKA